MFIDDPVIQEGFQSVFDHNLINSIQQEEKDSISVIKQESSTGAELPQNTYLWENYDPSFGDITVTFQTNFDILTSEDLRTRPLMIAFGETNQDNLHSLYFHNLVTTDFLDTNTLLALTETVVGIDIFNPYEEYAFFLIAGIVNPDNSITWWPLNTYFIDSRTFSIVFTFQDLLALKESNISTKFDRIFSSDPA